MLVVKGLNNEKVMNSTRFSILLNILSLDMCSVLWQWRIYNLEQLDVKTVPPWRFGDVHVAAMRVYHAWEGAVDLQAKKSLYGLNKL